MFLSIYSAMNSLWLANQLYNLFCNNLYMQLMLYPRTNFNGLKEIPYYMSWKDSRIFQVCQEFKVLVMSLKFVSRSWKFKLYYKLLFLQIKGIQHATIGHYWSQKNSFGCFCGFVRFNEQFMNLATVFKLSKNNMGEFFQWAWFTWRHQALYH